MGMQVLPLLLVIALFAWPAVCAFHEVREFNVRPNVDDSVSLTSGELECSFEYSVVGGSSELWLLELSIPDEGDATCVISRPDQATSYLFFKGYKASFKGAEASAEAFSSRSKALLLSEEYETAHTPHSAFVQPTKGWAGNLSIIRFVGYRAEQ